MEQLVEPPKRRYTVSEYFALEYSSEQKHEFREGEIISMPGGTESHSLIIVNVVIALGTRLRDSPCRVYESNLRVRPDRRLRYVYPDVFVACGPREFDADDPNHTTVMNPKVVIEVLSPSTELTDRTDKFDFYLGCPALEEYVMVSQNQPKVQTYQRQQDGAWRFAHFEGLSAVARLRSLGVDLPLAEVYSKVEFPPAPTENSPLS